MWRRKPGFNVCSGAGSARGGRVHLVVARLYAVAVPGSCSHSAECILLVVVSAAAAATKLLAGHGMIDVAASHTLTTVASRGWDVGVDACGPPPKAHTHNKRQANNATRATNGPSQAAAHASNQHTTHTAHRTLCHRGTCYSYSGTAFSAGALGVR